MRWEDERYVRLYTRDTTTWKLLKWEGRTVLMHLLRKVDRAGILDVEGHPAECVAAVADIPLDIAERGLAQLLDRKVFERQGDALVMPNFLTAQECMQSDAARKRSQRERDRAKALEGVTPRDQASRHVTVGHATGQKVTNGHAESHAVTVGHSVPSLAVPSRTQIVDAPLAPLLEASIPEAKAAQRAGRAKAKREVPEDFSPTDANKIRATQLGVDVESERVAFVEHHRARGNRFADVSLAFNTWLRNAERFSRQQRRGTPIQQEAKPGEYSWRKAAGDVDF